MRGAWCGVAIGLAACAAPKAPPGDPEAEVGAMLRRSAADWNRGDLEGFMSDYARDSLTSYLRRGHVQYGWQALHDHYQADYFAAGKHDGETNASLRRGDSVTASGPFTLLLQKRGDRWQILHDHTSSDPKP